jgi:hypothetical protein
LLFYSSPLALRSSCMKNRRQRLFRLFFSTKSWALLLLCKLLTAGCSSQPPAPTPANSATANKPAATNSIKLAADGAVTESAMQKAVFDDDSKLGRDPFFPNTTRRRSQQPTGETAEQEQQPILVASDYLKLTGIRPHRSRPLALINKSTFSPGESGEVQIAIPKPAGPTEIRKVLIRCLEIRSTSVVISIEGELGTKELRIAERP